MFYTITVHVYLSYKCMTLAFDSHDMETDCNLEKTDHAVFSIDRIIRYLSFRVHVSEGVPEDILF